VANRDDQTDETTGAASAAPVPPEFVRERGVYTKVQITGLELARTADVESQGGGVWTVGDCIVNFRRNEGTCAASRKSRPRTRCPHWWAVAYTVEPPSPEELVQPEIAVVAPAPQQIDVAAKMPSDEDLRRIAREKVQGGYKRDAKGYDEHLRSEFGETMFVVKPFFDVVGPHLENREQKKRGPKNMPMSDLLFAAFIHGHMNWSFRRTEGMLKFLADPRIGFIEDHPGFNRIDHFVRAPSTTPVLRDLLALTADPFRAFGKMTLAGDGTGLSTNRFDDWMIEGKHGIENRGTRGWRKAHVVCDSDVLAIVACYVTDKDVSEKRVILDHIVPELEVRDYDIEKFLLDGGYNATEIRDEIIEILNAVPYVPWGSNSRRAVSYRWRNLVKNAPLIEEVYARFKADEGAAFKAEYRYRVKVENLFSSIKTRFGGSVRALEGNGPENEVLLKCICHNVHMLLLAAKVYGLDINAMIGTKAA